MVRGLQLKLEWERKRANGQRLKSNNLQMPAGEARPLVKDSEESSLEKGLTVKSEFNW